MMPGEPLHALPAAARPTALMIGLGTLRTAPSLQTLPLELTHVAALPDATPPRTRVVVVNLAGVADSGDRTWASRLPKEGDTVLLHRGRPAEQPVIAEALSIGATRHVVGLDAEPDAATIARVVTEVVAGPAAELDRLKPGTRPTVHYAVNRGGHQHWVVGAAETFAANSGVDERLATLFANSTDELLANALVHGPVGASGVRPNTLLPSNAEVRVSFDQAVEFRFAFDGEWLALSVRDLFGSLDVRRVLPQIARAYHGASVRLSGPDVPVGLGLHQLARNATQLFVKVDPGRSTEITALFAASGSHRDRAGRARTFRLLAPR